MAARPVIAAALVAVSLTGVAATAAPGHVLLSRTGTYPAGCVAAVDGDLRDATGEVSVATDPQDPRRSVAVWMQDLRGASEALGIAAATTSDGGRSWQPAGRTRTSTCSGGTGETVRDPAVAWGPDGRVYLTTVVSGAGQTDPAGIQVSTSEDGGRSWGLPVSVASGTYLAENRDFPRVAVGSAPGEAYVLFFTARPGVLPLAVLSLFATTDGGRTWTERTAPATPPGTVFPAVELHSGPGGLVVVGIAVDPVVLAAALPSLSPVPLPASAPPLPSAVVLTRSSDGGRTWTVPAHVGDIDYPGRRVVDPDSGKAIEYLRVDGAVDQRTGTVHVVWQSADPWVVQHRQTTGTGTGLGPATVVAATRGPAFSPTLGVDGRGRVGLALYDLDDDVLGDGRTTTTVRLVVGDGTRWSQARPLLPAFDLRGSVVGSELFVGNQHALVGLRSGGFLGAMTVAGALSPGQQSAVAAVRVG